MESIYKKVIVNENDDVPSDGEYDTNLGMIEVFCGKWVADELPEWYLQEIELPTKRDIIIFLKAQGKPAVDTNEAWKNYNAYLAESILEFIETKFEIDFTLVSEAYGVEWSSIESDTFI